MITAALFDFGLDQIWDSLTSWIPPQLLSAQFSATFWIVLAIVLGGAAIAYFIPMTRSLFGAVGMAAIAYLVGMWKGIGDQADRQKKKDAAAKEAASQQSKPFKFPWDL